MNHLQIRKFLQALGTDPGETYPSEKWVKASCPLAPWTHDSGTDSHPSFAISCNPGGESIFNCYTCEHGDLLYLVQMLKKYGAEKPKVNLRAALEVLAEEENDDLELKIKDFDEAPPGQEIVIPWDEDWLSTFWRATKVPLAMEYLHGRNVEGGMAESLDIRWDGSRECVAFPIRDWGGRLVGLRGRRLSGGYYDYAGPCSHRNKSPWYGEHNVDLSQTVLFVESVFDLASASRVYRNCVAPLTVGMSKAKVQRLGGAFDIVTLFDNGVGGDKARALVDKYLGHSVRVHCLPPEGKSDPGEMGVTELCNVLAGKVNLDLDKTA